MKAAALSDLKKELQELEPAQLAELCINLAKYKKDNKEYLGYLLFESHDKAAFIIRIKNELDILFTELSPQTNLYFAKKGLRRILRILNKYIKYIGEKDAAAELLIYFCKKLKHSGIPIQKSVQLTNLFEQQLKKINAHIATMHPDLQYDFLKELEEIAE